MATEYYIVKPETHEIMCLGKHFVELQGIADWSWQKHADWLDYEDYKEIMVDLLRDNPGYFDYYTTTLSHLADLAIAIYDFCSGSPTYIDNDCSDNSKYWIEWKEVDGIYEIFEKNDICDNINCSLKHENKILQDKIDQWRKAGNMS